MTFFSAGVSSSFKQLLSRSTFGAVTSMRGYKRETGKPRCVQGDLYPKMPMYYDFHDAQRKSDPDALLRFYRLHWGGWIRTKAGRTKKLWKKGWDRRWWCRQHILLADRQAEDLEKMITPEYKKERYIVDDPYAPYHKRHGFDSLPRGKKKLSTSYIQHMWEY